MLETLFDYSFGAPRDEGKILQGIAETVDDWKKMMGGRISLEPHVYPYLERIKTGDRDAARNLYFL